MNTASRYINGWYYERTQHRRSWRKNGKEMCFVPKDWWHLSFGIWNFGAHERTTFSVKILGFSFYCKSPIQLKGDDDAWKFDLNQFGIRFDFGSKVESGYAKRRSLTFDYPWQMTRQKEVYFNLDGTPAYTHKDTGYWAFKIQRLLRMKRTGDWFVHRRKVEAILPSITKDFPYTYTRKNGETQERTVRCHITESTYGCQWFPFIREKSRTLEYEFNEEVGDGVDTWKGGVISSGEKMLPNETMEQAVRRLESTRVFDR